MTSRASPSGMPSPGATKPRDLDNGANVHRSQARPQILREDPGSGRDAEPHRGAEGVLRPVPADRGARGWTAGRGAPGGIQVRISHFRLLEHLDARVRAL